MAAAAEDDFKLVVFNVSNSDFDLAAWVRDSDLAGDAVGGMASGAVAALDSDSVVVGFGIIRRLAMLLVG
jgi:hypothetical protein